MRSISEDMATDPKEPWGHHEQHAIELACVYTDLDDWIAEHEGAPATRSLTATIRYAQRYIERAHHAVHAAIMIEKGGDFSGCQEDACSHLEEEAVIPCQCELTGRACRCKPFVPEFGRLT